MTYRLLTEPSEPLDAHWHARLKPVLRAAPEAFMLLMPPEEVVRGQREHFFRSGNQFVPELYPVINQVRLEEIAVALAQLHEDVATTETNEIVRVAYLDRIDEQLLTIEQVQAAGRHDGAAYNELNHELFGHPDRSVFQASSRWLRDCAQELLDAQPGTTEAEAVLQLVPDGPGDSSILFPDAETFEAVRALHRQPGGYLDQLFGPLDWSDRPILTPANTDDLTRKAIANIGSDYTLTDAPQGYWAVLHSSRRVARQPDYRFSPEVYLGIVSHEVGSHLLESVNGSRSRLRLLELGLDHYEAGNEGRALLREQITFPDFYAYVNQPDWSPRRPSWQARVTLHLVISLAAGLSGRPYSFPQAYEVVLALFRFWRLQLKSSVPDPALEQAAWSYVLRALKGTGPQNGGAYLKDIVYLEGNIRCWRTAAGDPQLILRGDMGKFDINNHKHVDILAELGI